MCGFCLQPNTIVATVHLKQTDGKWTTKVYELCQRCKDHLKGVYKYVN